MIPRKAPRPLDGRLYTDPGIFNEEMERIFSRLWVCGGRLEELDEPGRFVTREIGGESIIAVRTAAGDADPSSNGAAAANGNGAAGAAANGLAAFFNVCRHRGTRVVDECAGRAKVFQCPYHAWTYGLDGRLVGAPHMGRDFDAKGAGLVPVRIEALNGFFYLSLAADGPPLAEVAADLPDLSRFTLDRLVRGDRHEYEAQANWKILCENYNECYHCAVVHTLWPIEANRTRIVCEWLFDPDTARAPGFDPSDAVDFWHLVNSQDWKVCARTQLGVASRGYRPTAFEESEACIQVFDGWYLDQMGL